MMTDFCVCVCVCVCVNIPSSHVHFIKIIVSLGKAVTCIFNVRNVYSIFY